MNQQKLAWIGASLGIGLGVLGAVVGMVLPFLLQPGDQATSPENGRILAWGMGIGLTLFFGLMCVLFGYLCAIKPAQGPRERGFAIAATAFGAFFATAFPWLLYGLRNADSSVQSFGWVILGLYASIQLLKQWQETQLQIRSEEAKQSAQTKNQA